MHLVKMTRDDGHEVNVHPEMVSDYRTGGYYEVNAVEPAASDDATVAPRRRARRAKVVSDDR